MKDKQKVIKAIEDLIGDFSWATVSALEYEVTRTRNDADETMDERTWTHARRVVDLAYDTCMAVDHALGIREGPLPPPRVRKGSPLW